MAVSYNEQSPEARQYPSLRAFAIGSVAASVFLAGCAAGQSSSAERLRSAWQPTTLHILGRLANRSCQIDTLNTCRIGALAQDHKSTEYNGLIFDTDNDTVAFHSSSFTHDGARHTHDARITFAVVPTHRYRPGDTLTTETLEDMIPNGTIQSIECQSTTPSASLAATASFESDGTLIRPAGEHHASSDTAACLSQTLAALERSTQP